MRFSGERMPLLLFLAGAVATIALLLLVAFAPDLRSEANNDSNALSRSAVGFAGLKRLLELSGIPVEIDRGVKSGERIRPSLTIITPPITIAAQDWKDYDEQSAILIILPKWTAIGMPLKPEWVMKTGAYPPRLISRMISTIFACPLVQTPGDFKGMDVSAEPDGIPPAFLGDIQQLQYFSRPGREVARNSHALIRLMDDTKRLPPDGVAVLVQVRQGNKPIYVLSEPDLMNNQALGDSSRAQLGLAIIGALRQGNGPVWMDVTMNGYGRTPSLLKALFQPPFLGATLSAFLVAVLMALHALTRFGAAIGAGRVLVRGKMALATNSAELVRIMGREAPMAPRYLQAMRNLVLARLGARVRGAADEEALLARMEAASHSDIHYDALAAEAATARSGSDLLRVAAKAYAWKGKITSEHQ